MVLKLEPQSPNTESKIFLNTKKLTLFYPWNTLPVSILGLLERSDLEQKDVAPKCIQNDPGSALFADKSVGLQSGETRSWATTGMMKKWLKITQQWIQILAQAIIRRWPQADCLIFLRQYF